MSKNSELEQKHENGRLIDFLEDQEFRNWVFNPDGEKSTDTRAWEAVVQENSEARKAKYILATLKRHFDQNQLTHEEIVVRLELEIDKYRYIEVERWYTSPNGWWMAAASLVLLVGLFFLIQWFNRPFNVYTTNYGEQMTIELPDKSLIQLNSNSRLTWDRDWLDTGIRRVQLEGEAYFEVEGQDQFPLEVHTDDITIHVIGTQFNVNSRRKMSRVYLDKGKVDVEVKTNPEERYAMEPGEELVYRGGTVEKNQIEGSEEISSWKEGMLVFRNEPLMNVLKSVSDIYGKEFVVKDTALVHRNITTTIPLTNWNVSLAAIQLAMRLEIEVENDTVRIEKRK